MIVGTVGGIFAWLIANGPSLISGISAMSAVVTSFFSMFGGKSKDHPVTREEFNAFVDECLGDEAKRLAIIAVAKGDLGPVA